jgi:hypothetical protein
MQPGQPHRPVPAAESQIDRSRGMVVAPGVANAEPDRVVAETGRQHGAADQACGHERRSNLQMYFLDVFSIQLAMDGNTTYFHHRIAILFQVNIQKAK